LWPTLGCAAIETAGMLDKCTKASGGRCHSAFDCNLGIIVTMNGEADVVTPGIGGPGGVGAIDLEFGGI
jgi:hypothetical protein